MEDTRKYWISIHDGAEVMDKGPGEFDYFKMMKDDLPFCHQCFRKTFNLDYIPEKATISIAARSLYKCHINGEFVMFGPARSPKGYVFADQIDVAQYLRKGRNVIAVEIVYVGPITEYDFGESGFCCKLELDTETIYSGDDWKYHNWNAFASNAEAGRLRVYPAEKIDLNKIDLHWKSCNYDDSYWENAPAAHLAHDEVRPRPFPLPELDEMPPPRIIDCSGVCLDGKTIKLSESGENNYVILDFGRTVSGLYEVSGKIPKEAVVTFSYLEWLNQFDGSAKKSGYPGCNSSLFRIVGDGDHFAFQTFHPYSCRYLKIHAESLSSGSAAEIFRVRAREVCSLPTVRSGHAFCSNPVLNRIIEAAQNTLRVCAPDMYVDCSSHERRIYLHDSLWQIEVGNIFFGDTAISRQFIEMVCDSTGRLEKFPSMIQNGVLCSGGSQKSATLSHNLTWILQGFKHAELTKEPLPTRFFTVAKNMLSDLASVTTTEGLIEHSGNDLCMFLDWSKMYSRNGISTAMNALYYKALKKLGEEMNSNALLLRAEKLCSEMRKLIVPFLSSKSMRNARLIPDLFVRDPEGELVPLASENSISFGPQSSIMRSETTQYWVLWSGILEKDEQKRLWEVLRELRINEESRTDDNRLYAVSRSGLFGLWVRMTYAFEIGDDEVVYRDIHDICKPMVEMGDTLWESICSDSRSNAHAYNAIVGTLLYKLISGIRHDSGQLTIAPRPGNFGLTWGRGFMKLETGVLNTSWTLAHDLFRLEITLPENVSAKVVLPPKAAAIAARGGHTLKKLEFAINSSATISVSSENGLVINRNKWLDKSEILGNTVKIKKEKVVHAVM